MKYSNGVRLSLKSISISSFHSISSCVMSRSLWLHLYLCFFFFLSPFGCCSALMAARGKSSSESSNDSISKGGFQEPQLSHPWL